MGLFKGLTKIVASPFILVNETVNAAKDIFDNDFELKDSIHVSTYGATLPIEGALKTIKKITEGFEE